MSKSRKSHAQAAALVIREARAFTNVATTGDCYDNAPKECFGGKLKTELVYLRKFTTHEQAKSAIFDHIEVFYNRQRLHSLLITRAPNSLRPDSPELPVCTLLLGRVRSNIEFRTTRAALSLNPVLLRPKRRGYDAGQSLRPATFAIC